MPAKKTRRTAREIRQREAARRQRQQKLRSLGPWGGGAAVMLIAVVALVLFTRQNPSAAGGGCAGPAPTSCVTTSGSLSDPGTPNGQTIDGIACNSEMVAFHIHAHLAIYDNGKPVTVPAGIGMVPPRVPAQVTATGPLSTDPTSQNTFFNSAKCFYWIHTHDATGVIHMEAPAQTTFRLGEVFDLWGQKLSATTVGPLAGKQTVYVDGTPYEGNPYDIPLNAHTQVQIDVGSSPPAFKPFTFPPGE